MPRAIHSSLASSSLVSSTLVAGTALLFVLTGCPGQVADAPREACTSYYEALIAYNERCELAFPDRIGPARAGLEEACARQITAPGVTRLAARLNRCASELSAASCDDSIACFREDAVRGELPAGAPCGEGAQCESGHCRRSSDVACGVCSSLGERSPVGGPCDSVGCVDGSVCVSASGGSKCTAVKVAEVDQPCGDSPDAITGCAKGLHCVGNRGGHLGTCRVPSRAGDACRTRDDCTYGLTCEQERCSGRLAEGAQCESGAHFVCEKGLACEDGACRKIVRVKTGEPCNLTTRLCERGDCREDSRDPPGEDDGSTARCVDQLREEEACEWAGACETPARCIAGKCTIVDPSACK